MQYYRTLTLVYNIQYYSCFGIIIIDIVNFIINTSIIISKFTQYFVSLYHCICFLSNPKVDVGHEMLNKNISTSTCFCIYFSKEMQKQVDVEMFRDVEMLFSTLDVVLKFGDVRVCIGDVSNISRIFK